MGHSTVLSSSFDAISTSVANGSWPRSSAMSPTMRPFSPSLASENVSPMT